MPALFQKSGGHYAMIACLGEVTCPVVERSCISLGVNVSVTDRAQGAEHNRHACSTQSSFFFLKFAFCFTSAIAWRQEVAGEHTTWLIIDPCLPSSAASPQARRHVCSTQGGLAYELSYFCKRSR